MDRFAILVYAFYLVDMIKSPVIACVFVLINTVAAAQLGIIAAFPMEKAKLEKQKIGEDSLVWKQDDSVSRTIKIPPVLLPPAAYTLSFQSGVLRFRHTVLLEKGALLLTLKKDASGAITIIYSGNDGPLNTAHDEWAEQLSRINAAYTYYHQQKKGVDSLVYKETKRRWSHQLASFLQYKQATGKRWKGRALEEIIRHTWGEYVKDNIPTRVKALTEQLTPLQAVFSANLLETKDNEFIDWLLSTRKVSTETVADTLLTYLPLLLQQAQSNDSLLLHWSAGLRKQFRQFGMDALEEMMDTRFLSQTCNAGKDLDLQQRLRAYQHTRPGAIAPPIGKEGSDVVNPGDSVLVVFWASWCPHCREQLPGLKTYLKSRPAIQVVAIALDDNKTDWTNASSSLQGWQHVQAEKKWDDPLVLAYGIYATPTMFLLDSNRRVVQKINSIDAFIR